jgi:cyanuric acid amidohydrolase
VPDPIEVRKVPIRHVSDASGLAELIDSGAVEAARVIAVIGKTEGNGGVNDYTRIIADRAFREVLVHKGHPNASSVPIVWSGGTDGVLCRTRPSSPPPRRRLPPISPASPSGWR